MHRPSGDHEDGRKNAGPHSHSSAVLARFPSTEKHADRRHIKKEETMTLQGNTIVRRIGYPSRGSVAYISPLDTMEEYLRFSREHENRVLWPESGTHIGRYIFDDSNTSIVFWSLHAGLMLVGDVVGAGHGYDPKHPLPDYLAPEPWCRFPARYWVMIDNLRELDDFDPDDYWQIDKKDGSRTRFTMEGEHMWKASAVVIVPKEPSGKTDEPNNTLY